MEDNSKVLLKRLSENISKLEETCSEMEFVMREINEHGLSSNKEVSSILESKVRSVEFYTDRINKVFDFPSLAEDSLDQNIKDSFYTKDREILDKLKSGDIFDGIDRTGTTKEAKQSYDKLCQNILKRDTELKLKTKEFLEKSKEDNGWTLELFDQMLDTTTA